MNNIPRSELLKDLIHNEQTDRAIEMVRDVKNECWVCEEGVLVVLSEEKSAQELVEAVLETFLNIGTNRQESRHHEHNFWVRCLSQFSPILWEHRMDRWIKKFNEVAFQGANEFHDYYSYLLVNDFGNYAKFDDDPTDFSFTPMNLRWLETNWENWPAYEYSQKRIEMGRFESEKAFLRWKLDYLECELQMLTEDYQYMCKPLEKEIQKIRAALSPSQ